MINFNNGTLRVQGHWLNPTNSPVPPDPYNPLGLPPYTMRLKYRQGDTPTPRTSDIPETFTLVDADENIWDCNNVESGALALYNQLSTQTTPPSNHSQTFYDCGSNTTTGAAELAQVPSDWK